MFSNPITSDLFFGRHDILSLLKKRTQSHEAGYRQNIALIGLPLYGKTSLLHYFLKVFVDQSLIYTYVCLKGLNLEEFIDRFSSVALYNYLKADGKQTQEDFQFLLKSAKISIPKTVSLIEKSKEFLKKKELQSAFSLILDLPDVLSQETNKKCLVVLDEFQELESLKTDNPFALLGKKIMVQKDAMYIIASSSPWAARKILSEKLHLLFGNFELIDIKGFDIKISRDFLNFKLGKESQADRFSEFLIALTQGNPFYLENISRSIKTAPLLSRQNLFTAEDLISHSLENLLLDPSGAFNLYFQQVTKDLPQGKNTDYTGILLALADNCCRMKDLSRILSKNSKDLSKQIQRLVELDIIEKSGTFYRIQDEMYKFWLQKVYRINKTSFFPDAEIVREKFRREILALLNKFSENSKRPVQDIVAELLRAFRNETVEIDQKHLLLPHFLHVEQKIYKNEDEKIVAAHGSKHWFCFIKDQEVNEQDVARFASKCKGFKKNITRKIIVALEGMDMNAKLLAKEERIWPWTISDLNLLLNFYNKTPVIK